MNRNRKIPKKKKKSQRAFFRNQAAAKTDPFSEVPTGTLCQSIMLLVDELRKRGFPLKDFDHKERTLQQVQILGGSIYFLAAPEQEEEQNEASQETRGV